MKQIARASLEVFHPDYLAQVEKSQTQDTTLPGSQQRGLFKSGPVLWDAICAQYVLQNRPRPFVEVGGSRSRCNYPRK